MTERKNQTFDDKKSIPCADHRRNSKMHAKIGRRTHNHKKTNDVISSREDRVPDGGRYLLSLELQKCNETTKIPALVPGTGNRK
jgi:hypothetical protein